MFDVEVPKEENDESTVATETQEETQSHVIVEVEMPNVKESTEKQRPNVNDIEVPKVEDKNEDIEIKRKRKRKRKWIKSFFIAALHLSFYAANFQFKGLCTTLSDDGGMSLFLSIIVATVQEGARDVLMIPIAWLADAYVGRCKILLLSAILYTIGLAMWYKPYNIGLHYSYSLMLIIIGQSGYEYYIKRETVSHNIGSEVVNVREEENNNYEEKTKKAQQLTSKDGIIRILQYYLHKVIKGLWKVYKVFWISIVGLVITLFVLPKFSDKVQLIILIGALLVSAILFLVGMCIYCFEKPVICERCKYFGHQLGHELLRMFKRWLLVEKSAENLQDNNSRRHKSVTRRLRCINEQFRQFFQNKQFFTGDFGLSLVFLMFGAMSVFGDTFFAEQGNAMNNLPTQVFVVASDIGIELTKQLCNWILVKKINASPNRRFYIRLEMGLGILLSIPCFLIASLVETRRLKEDISVAWLTPQILLIGAMNGLASSGLQHFLKEMPIALIRAYASILAEAIVGMGKLLSILGFIILYYVTKIGDEHGWFGENIYMSRFDYYYRLMVGFGLINLFIYVWVGDVYYRRQSQVIPDNSVEANVGDVESGIA